MSRSGYTDDCDDQWAHIRWRGAVTSAIRGKRGQAFFRELLAAMDAMPEKQLISQTFGDAGSYCTLGVACAARGVEAPKIEDPDDYYGSEVADMASAALGVPSSLCAEVMYWNDEGAWGKETPEERWTRMRTWIAKKIKDPQP
jgi:hypothetical protein